MERKTLSADQVDALTAKLPDWAISPHPTKKFLSVINPMVIVDRLNEVFGFGGWIPHYIEVEKGDSPVVKCILLIPEYGIEIAQYGGNNNQDRGDAYKGAATDALTKCASYLGIGASIYKGQGNVGAGLGIKEWARVRDNYVQNGVITPDDYEQCSYIQKLVITEFKKAKNKDNGTEN